MSVYGVVRPGSSPGNLLLWLILPAAIACGWSRPAWAKEPSLTAIELFDGPSGPAYVQLADVLINGKAELRRCQTPAGVIDKSSYGKLSHIPLAPGATIERTADGALRYFVRNGTGEDAPVCVVPDNLKFEHSSSVSPSALADMADLRGRPVAPGSDGTIAVPPLKRGVKLVFVATPDAEKAEFLLAQRKGSQAGWQNYLAKYPAGANADQANRVLAQMYVDDGEKALATYRKSLNTDMPSYDDLNKANAAVIHSHARLPNSASEVSLAAEIQAALGNLVEKGDAELGAYNKALEAKTTGFIHLGNAQKLVKVVEGVNPNLPALLNLRDKVAHASESFNAAMSSAEKDEAAKQWESALERVKPYRAFATEEPRVAKIIDDAYQAYFEEGQQKDAIKEWKSAIASYENALKAKQTGDAESGLKAAQQQYAIQQDQAAATAAREKSQALESQRDVIHAYELLTSLSDKQQILVKDDIERLEPGYLTAAAQRAKDIAKANVTIAGIGDEKAVEQAYALRQRVDELTDNDAQKQQNQLSLQNLSDELSTWFLDCAKQKLQKPMGSETELGWWYLKEAESYHGANLEQVRDQMKLADPAHQMHSRLSIRVQFRDQTSQRQSEGFAGQMESAIALGLDSSGMSVKIVRSNDTIPPDHLPDFLLSGDVLDHNISVTTTVESKDSKYVAEVHEVPSDEWRKLNRQFESANDSLKTAQAALQGAEQKANKKLLADARKQADDARSKLDAIRAQLDAIPKNRTEDVVRAYSYTKTTHTVANRISMQLRIDDGISGHKGDPVPVTKEEQKSFEVISDVKPEDANGIKNQGTTPNQVQMQNELENQAREELIKAVLAKVIELPRKIYEDGQRREQDGYADDAGEAYLRFLNVAPPDMIPEREHAQKFLKEQFNFQTFPGQIREHLPSSPPLEQGMTQPASQHQP